MMEENQIPIEDPEAADLEDVQQDDEVIHDQLPSIEEAKANAKLDIAPDNDPTATKPRRRCLWYSCCCVCVALILVVVLAAAAPHVEVKPTSNRVDGSNSGLETLAPGTFEPRFNYVKDFLSGLSDSDALNSEGSPQQLAAKWIADEDVLHLALDDDGFVERYALAVFYFALDGPNWPLQLSFLSEKETCKWFQYGFSSDEKAKHVGAHCEGTSNVKQLFFPQKWLNGPFPPELALLKELSYISIYRNPGIQGDFPSVLRKLPKLEYLALHFCALSGSLPDWLGEMTSLTSLVLSNNALHGALPSTLPKMTNLEQLFLDDNRLKGNILDLKPLSNLRALLLEDNEFHGTIGSSLLDSWKHIEIMDISGNNLTSSIPENLFTRNNLTVVDLSRNSLTGTLTIPRENKAMNFLALHENKLKGSIPSTISHLEKLTHLDLSSNELTSNFPTSLGSMKELKYLFAAVNPLDEGEIPTFLRKLTKLEDLSLKATNLTGTLPSWLGEISTLKLLDLDSNKLHGTIPSEFGDLSQLRFLLLNRNQLHGRIPKALGFVSTLDFLLLERNNFNVSAQHICDREKKPQVFLADCVEEVDCPCCTYCCSDDDEWGPCQDDVWLGSVDPIWETKYERVIYRFENITFEMGE